MRPARCEPIGAQREGRTPTLLREPDFESGASASSAIRAYPFNRPYGRIFIARSHVPVNPHPLSLPELQCYNLRPTLISYLVEGLASWQKSSASHADKPEKPLQTLSSWESLRLRSKQRSASPVGKNGKACESWLSTSIKSIWVKRAAENSSRSR